MTMTIAQFRVGLKYISNGVAKLAARIRKILLRKPAAPTGKPNDALKKGLDEDESYQEFSRKVTGLDDIIIKLGVHERMAASHQYMYEMGRRDGALGVRLDNLPNIARAIAKEMFRHIYVIIKGKIAAQHAEVQASKSIKDSDESLYNREQAYYNYVKYQSRFFPRNYSFFLFMLYLVVSFALILADIPLAFKLIRDGFNIQGSPRYPFQQLFIDGNFLRVLAHNWETVFTAFGIALCTIYIKIYYDEFVGTPYANRVMTFKRFMSENGFESEAGVKENIQKEHREKVVAKTLIFIVTILAIVVLAYFRLEVAARAKLFEVTFFSKAACIAITLLFPLIGGICLSYSLNNIQNLTRLWSAKRHCSQTKGEWTKSVKEYSIIEKTYNDLEAAGEKLLGEHLIEEYVEYLIAFYERGYAIGGMQPDKYIGGEDFFTKILEWRNLAVSRKISINIGISNSIIKQ